MFKSVEMRFAVAAIALGATAGCSPDTTPSHQEDVLGTSVDVIDITCAQGESEADQASRLLAAAQTEADRMSMILGAYARPVEGHACSDDAYVNAILNASLANGITVEGTYTYTSLVNGRALAARERGEDVE